jgi:hypothetical protein
MSDMELPCVYYNKGYYECFTFEKNGYFYIGNGNVFLFGVFKQLIPGETKLNIVFINSYYKYNTNYISTNSYETIARDIIYDSCEEILDTKEMIKLWNKYKNYKCTKKFHFITSFKVNKGNLLSKLYIKPMNLVDYILYNNLIKEEDMECIPIMLHDKVNYYYDKNIFNTQYSESFI